MLRSIDTGVVRLTPSSLHHSERMPSKRESSESFARLVAHLSFANAELLERDIDTVRRALGLPEVGT